MSTDKQLLLSERHIDRMNLFGICFLFLHIPVMAAVAWQFGTGIGFAAMASLAICAGPAMLWLLGGNRKLLSVIIGMSLMFFSALLIHLGRGMIELHFHVFVMLALVTIFGNIAVPLAAAATIAVHHLGFFFFLPDSVFNYKASLGIVLVHAAFVIVETLPVTYLSLIFGRFVRAQDLVVGQLSSKIASLDSAANILVQQSEEAAASTSEQSAAIQQTDTALNQVQVMISETSNHVRNCIDIANLVQENTKSGANIMDELSIGLEGIQQTNNHLQEILKTIEEIGSKTEVINSIVQKTELLSFNASIEAARAGEQGKGFAIVAVEMGKLAQTSGSAAMQIEKLIGDSRRFVAEIVKSVEEKTSKGRIVGDQSVKNYANIQEQINTMLEKIKNISEATNAQEKSVSLSVSAMEQLGMVAKKTVANSSEFRGLADRLKGESSEFDRVYRETKILIFGKESNQKSA